MQTVIKGRHFAINDAVREYLTHKIERLDRHLSQPAAEATIEFFQKQSRTAGQRVGVQVTVNASGALLRAEHQAADFFSAIDTVADSLDRQIARYKGRLIDRHKLGSPSLRAEAPAEAPLIARTKRFVAEAMDPEEAVDRMELLGHDFFVYANAAHGGLEVVYRRREGGYGVLSPQPV